MYFISRYHACPATDLPDGSKVLYAEQVKDKPKSDDIFSAFMLENLSKRSTIYFQEVLTIINIPLEGLVFLQSKYEESEGIGY